MDYYESYDEDYIVIKKKEDEFSLRLFVYEQLPSKTEIIEHLENANEFFCKNIPFIISRTTSEIIRLKRTTFYRYKN
tara:strand:+ start:71 stop:301 length:231 start_codon:yes stop_codon:yes gene_type:complete